MTNEELHVYLSDLQSEAESSRDSFLQENIEGLQYYHGRLPKQHASGGSKWVDRTVYDQHRGVSAQLGDTFANADSVVKYSTQNPQHQMFAKVATKHVNEQILQKNNGYSLIRRAIQACLLEKASYLMPYWVESTTTERIDVVGIPAEAVAVLNSDPTVIAIELDNDDELFSGYYEIEHDTSHLAIDVVPFEAVSFEPTARSIYDTTYMVRKINKLRGVFLEEGIKVHEDARFSDDNEPMMDSLRTRETAVNVGYDYSEKDPNREMVSVWEHYIQMKLDGQFGWWKVVADSKDIISKEKVSGIPFAMLTPLPTPFTIYGDSIPDITKDIQQLRTFTVRGMIDSVMQTNHPRYTAMKGQYNKQHLENNKPNGIVEIQSPGAINLLPVQPVSNEINTLYQMVQQAINTRTGLSDAAQGLDDSIFKNDNAYATVQAVMSQALQRTKEIALNLAHGGISDFMMICYETIRENDKNTYQTVIEGTPFEYSPSQWPEVIETRVDSTISPVDKIARTNALRAFKMEADTMPAVKELQLTGVQQQFNYLHKIGAALNLTQGDISDLLLPLEAGTPPQPNPIQQIEVQKAQAELGLIQANTQLQAASAQKVVADITLDKGKLMFEQQKAAEDDQRADEALRFQQEKAADEITIARDKLMLEREKIDAEISLEINQRRAVSIG